MNENFVGDYPAHIPMMPEKVIREDVERRYNLEQLILEEHKLPLGLDFEDVELVSLEVDKSSIVTAIKPNEQEYLNHLILDHLSVYSREHVVLLADADENMAQYANEVSSYYSSPSDLTMIRKGFSQEIAARKMEKDLHLKEKLYLLIM